MVEKKENNGVWKYYWTAGGMLKAVQRPDGSIITFKYDAFGRRISKKYLRREFLYIWDKNVPLHEIQKEELCEDNIITWIFEGFTPTAKLINGKAYSIISDHTGTPLLAVDTNGVKVWERELDIYGKVRKEFTHDNVKDRRSGFIPFLYAGQYYDVETELAYNRFRYYDCNTGSYISQDPIGLKGRNLNIYAYVWDTNTWVDVFGLDCSQNLKIDTPWGEALQSNLQEALDARKEVEKGATLYRMGTMKKSETIGAQFWALEHPFSEGYADRYGIPQENIVNSDFIMTGELKEGASFITRPAPGIGENLGGGIEVVVPKDAVSIITFSTL
ncbi:RHS repeat domain-containing protein [Capnocytophaga canis]|uniref:RHS repeat domain-containing protein n=1 Tax=Capnocytophaga canis TaxID=1848903 RepID=UPI0023EF36A7|nr:RHS repeat-associated core domain-containing protein [Capnocytophaga canis]